MGVRVIIRKISRCPRGYAFLTFADVDVYTLLFAGILSAGQILKCCLSVDNTKQCQMLGLTIAL